MAEKFYIRRNDRRPILVAELSDEDGPVDLSAASAVEFHMSSAIGSTAKIEAAATVSNATEGEVTYTWVTGDTDTAGSYLAEFEVTWTDGTQESYPDPGYFLIVVSEDLA